MASTTPKHDVFHLEHLQPGLGAEEPAAFHVIIYQNSPITIAIRAQTNTFCVKAQRVGMVLYIHETL